MLLMLAGCEQAFHAPVIKRSPPDRGQYYESYELENLIRFAGDFASRPPADRLVECRKILQLHQAKPALGVQLHLFLAQIITPDCGDSQETFALLEATRSQIRDPRLARYLAYHGEVLQRLYAEKNQAKSLKHQLQQTSYKQQKLSRLLKAHQAELKALQEVQAEMVDKQAEIENKRAEVKALQEKLDALKTIEQNLAEPRGN
jgi:DNA repair exonuclease SbcCD ATPase subunit